MLRQKGVLDGDETGMGFSCEDHNNDIDYVYNSNNIHTRQVHANTPRLRPKILLDSHFHRCRRCAR